MTASGETYVALGAWAVMGVLFCAAATAGGANAPRVRVVPKPAEMKVSDGAARAFHISTETVILHDKATAELAEMLQGHRGPDASGAEDRDGDGDGQQGD